MGTICESGGVGLAVQLMKNIGQKSMDEYLQLPIVS